MAEYIERGFALDVVKRTSGDYAAAFAEIAHAPAAEVVEVRHGRWVVYGGGVFCSNCGVALKKGKIEPIGFHFCPNCGALMREVGNGEK